MLLSVAEKTAANILAEETAARSRRAFEASVVPDCQPNPDYDPNQPSSDTTTIPTKAPTSSHGDLLFLQDKFLLDDDNNIRAKNAYNNKDTANLTLLLTQKVIQLLIDANQKNVIAVEFRTRQEEIEQDWQVFWLGTL